MFASRFGGQYNRYIQPLVMLVDENSCAHALIIALNLAFLVHLWMGAATSRKHAHASTGKSLPFPTPQGRMPTSCPSSALMEIIYATIATLTCTPLVPRQYGSSISVIAAIPNFIFGFGICWAGDIGWRDMVGLFGGDDSIRERDRVKME